MYRDVAGRPTDRCQVKDLCPTRVIHAEEMSLKETYNIYLSTYLQSNIVKAKL